MPLTFPRSTTRERLGSRVSSWLARPVSLWGCVIGWIVATAVYVTICTIVGISTEGDARVSVFIGWALAHGHFACGYPPGSISRNLAAPIYPLISGAASAIFRIGHGVTFPSNASLGPHCATAYAAMDQFSRYLGFAGAPSFALPGIDFVRAAEAFGARGVRVDRAAALEAAFATSFASPTPTLVDVAVDDGAGVIY